MSLSLIVGKKKKKIHGLHSPPLVIGKKKKKKMGTPQYNWKVVVGKYIAT